MRCLWEKTTSAPCLGEKEKQQFPIGSGLKNTAEFPAWRRYNYNKSDLGIFIPQCFRAELYNKVATNYMQLFDELTLNKIKQNIQFLCFISHSGNHMG